MNVKRSLVAVGATGAVAAAIFGGSAVSTAFSSQSATQYAEGQGASLGVTVANGTFDATGLVPGATPTSEGPVTISNNGNTDGTASITFGAFTVKTDGSDGHQPSADDLIFDVAGQSIPASQLAGQTIQLGTIGGGANQSYPVTVGLASGTGNDWNGADAYLPYTVTLTAGS